MESNLNGTWLFVKTGDQYGDTDLIEFDGDDILHFLLKNTDGSKLYKEIINGWVEKSIDLNYKIINSNRIRFYKKGIKLSVISENERISEEILFELDYEKLFPTQTDLSPEEIQLLKFDFSWNRFKKIIEFNKILDSPEMQELHKITNRIGSKILLEKFAETLFVSFYNDEHVSLQLPIKYVDSEIMILYGFPNEPYEVTCQVLK
ncbi:MAG: hypothetical protein ACK4M1_08465 [Flavobacterium sp.]